MINGFGLKIIMLGFMMLGSIATFIPDAPYWFSCAGQVVAPVFFFLLVEGFLHTKSKEKYTKRLVIASQIMFIGNTLISFLFQKKIDETGKAISVGENLSFGTNKYIVLGVILLVVLGSIIYAFKQNGLRNKIALILCFILVVANSVLIRNFDGLYIFRNNIFLSLALSLIMLRGIGVYKETKSSKAATLAGLAFSFSTVTEALTFGPLMVLIFYFFRENKKKMYGAFILLSSLMLINTDMQILFRNNFWMMGFASIFILLYNGKRGKEAKWLFYSFYPLQIWIIYIISFYIK